MADNNIGKPLTMVEKVTEPNANSNVIINDNGNVHQVAVNDLLKNSDVNTSLENTINGTVANILKPTLVSQTTKNGVTCTPQSDGTFVLNGTATETTTFVIFDITNSSCFNNYKLVGCPVGGDNSSKYNLFAFEGGTSIAFFDIGNGIKITRNASSVSLNLNIRVYKGFTATNLVFKPMITANLSATYNDFVPYTGDSGRLNEDVSIIKNTLVSKIGFIDTSNIIIPSTPITSNTTYTATQDCYIIITASQITDSSNWVGVQLTINNFMIWEVLTKTAKDGCAYNFPLKKGQTINIKQDGSGMMDNVTYKVLGMI